MKGGALFPVRVRYEKRGKVRWISHRDVARAFERAFRVEALPLAFSQGFSPHPKVSFGLALSTGHESVAEYLDLELVSEVDLELLPAALSTALPEGLTVTAAAPLVDRAPALQEAVTSVEWLVAVTPHDAEPDPEVLRALVADALAREALPTARRRKGKETVEDVRPVIRAFDVLDDSTPLVPDSEVRGVHAHLELTTQPRSAKPDEVLTAVVTATGANAWSLAHVTRTHQWIERDGARQEPLDADTRPRDVFDARATREGTDVRPRDHRDDDPGRAPSVAGGAVRS